MLFKDNSVDAELKIMDFGLAKLVDPDGKNTAAATMTTPRSSRLVLVETIRSSRWKSARHNVPTLTRTWRLTQLDLEQGSGLRSAAAAPHRHQRQGG